MADIDQLIQDLQSDDLEIRYIVYKKVCESHLPEDVLRCQW